GVLSDVGAGFYCRSALATQHLGLLSCQQWCMARERGGSPWRAWRFSPGIGATSVQLDPLSGDRCGGPPPPRATSRAFARLTPSRQPKRRAPPASREARLDETHDELVRGEGALPPGQ